MACPICTGERIPSDASVVDKLGKRVILQGKVYAIIPPNYTYFLYRNYATVSLYPRKGKVKHLKFGRQRELEIWLFETEENFIVEGCLHVVDNKELVFDITSVETYSR